MAIDAAVEQLRTAIDRIQNASTRSTGTPELQGAADRVTVAAERALAARNDPDRFRERLAEYMAARHSFIAAADMQEATIARMDETNRPGIRQSITNFRGAISDTPMPAITTLVPGVVFTVGAGTTLKTKAPLGVGINTSLLGAAAGTAFDALGSSTLKDYFTNNISGGVAIPASGDGKLSNALGLGLGGVSFNARGNTWAFWPVFALEQLDTSDVNIPAAVKLLKPSQASWSQPSIAIGIPILGLARTIKLVQCGKLAPILSIGLRLPYYFPGDSYTALAAAFSNRHTEYQRAGGSTVTLSVDIPLLKVAKDAPTGC